MEEDSVGSQGPQPTSVLDEKRVQLIIIIIVIIIIIIITLQFTSAHPSSM
jgi:hypothetical protein